jgi:hypothetical protein
MARPEREPVRGPVTVLEVIGCALMASVEGREIIQATLREGDSIRREVAEVA